jgi:hypothetical protein
MINTAIKYSFPLNRWLRLVSAIIEKDPGLPKITRLRIIHLYEAEMNWLFRNFFNKITWRAEDSEALSDEQYGSRKGKTAIDVAMKKIFTYTIMGLTKTDGATFHNDAKACYDRIRLLLVFLRSRRLGMSQEVCDLNAKTLSSLKFFHKTSWGISDEYYTDNPEQGHPIHGSGQGAKPAPQIWGAISTMIMDIYLEKSTGFTTVNPQHTNTAERHTDGFVDDVTTWLNDIRQLENKQDEVIPSDGAHDLIHAWKRQCNGGNSTGSELELSKWKFGKNGIATMATRNELSRGIEITQAATIPPSQSIAKKVAAHTKHSASWHTRQWIPKQKYNA